MTTGTTALLAWFRQSTSRGPSTTNTMTSGPSTTRRRNAPPRKYVVHTGRMCFECKQEGHYVRDCPRVTNQKPTKTKMEEMQALLRSMTMTERAEFKEHILDNKGKLRTKTTTTLLSRETSPHTDRTFTGVLLSRETGPHIRQTLRRFAKMSERCERCDGTHPTRICMKRFLKPRELESNPHLIHDDDSARSDTLCGSEELESDEAKPTIDPSAHPLKTVTFDLPSDELARNNTPCHTNKPEKDDDDSIDTQQPASQSEETDTRLVHTAWLRKTSDNVYMSNRKSMNLKAYVHAAHRRTEVPTLLDSGATENFMNLTYAKWLKLPFKRLPYERSLLNVDGTTNKMGSLKYYVDLQVQTGTKRTNMHFFLTDLGHHRVILGYPWFAANQPKIDWARGWIDTVQLPLILRDAKAEKPQFNPSTRNLPDPVESEILYIGRITVVSQITRQTMSSTLAEEHDRPNLTPIPTEYRRHRKVFSEEAAQRFPESCIWDHAIELKPGAPSTLPRKIYTLSQLELQELQKFIKEHLAKGYIHPSKSPYAALFFFIKKKDGKLRPVQDY